MLLYVKSIYYVYDIAIYVHNNIIVMYQYYYFPDTVTPIDFEYGGPNFLIFDIANHFCEFGGKCVMVRYRVVILKNHSINKFPATYK
jgi:hypothetical protein